MKELLAGMLILLLTGSQAAQPPSAALSVQWHEGAQDCAAAPSPSPLQVHRHAKGTFLLRQNPCASFEAPFLYLLIGRERALLIDSGAVADPRHMPLAATVMGLLPETNGAKLPLVVAHTHSHRDHREGDVQFAGLSEVTVLPTDVASVRRYFGMDPWPDGIGHIDLGHRMVQVLATPGHKDNHVVFFDEATGLLFSGDFLLPGRLTVQDSDAFERSAQRLASFVRDRPVTHVLGGHIELSADGALYPMGATHHPNERRLELGKAEVLALPDAVRRFNGFYSRYPQFAITHPKRNLTVVGAGAVLVLGAFAWWLVRLVRRRRSRRLTQPVG
ncbi:MBL fold metallo-hydrolase [Lysobacter soli]|uniref:MBL fold metallo-hydrolase n=1 Tax=Lysobacter soli TaxID=453783 RepID=UPI0037CB23B7